ncbi:MAG: hypothetical protein V2A79_19160 [Planctomycetota bacterium]
MANQLGGWLMVLGAAGAAAKEISDGPSKFPPDPTGVPCSQVVPSGCSCCYQDDIATDCDRIYVPPDPGGPCTWVPEEECLVSRCDVTWPEYYECLDPLTGNWCWPDFNPCETYPHCGECWCDQFFDDPCPCDCGLVVTDACHEAVCENDTCITQSIDCDDHNPCTNDGCDHCDGCWHAPKCPPDSNPCTIDWCDAGGNCHHDPAAEGASCGNCKTCQEGACVTVCAPGENCCDGHCCAYPCYQCVDHGALSGGTITANPNPACVGQTITFTVSGVTDSGGQKRENCVLVPIAPVGPTFTWTISRPVGGPLSGSRPVATVVADCFGQYTCTFSATTNRECPPSPRQIGPATVTVGPTAATLTRDPAEHPRVYLLGADAAMVPGEPHRHLEPAGMPGHPGDPGAGGGIHASAYGLCIAG